MWNRGNGLEGYFDITSPDVLPLSTWPLPQIVELKHKTLFITHDKIYELTKPYTVNALKIVDKQGAEIPITNTKQLHIADLEDTWFGFSPKGVVRSSENDADVLYLPDAGITTGCSYNGRVFFGGFSSDATWSDEILNLFTAAERAKLRITNDMVMWTSLNGIELDWFLGLKTPTVNDFRQAVLKNLFGFIPLRVGKILHIESIPSGVLVFGEKGCELLYQNGELIGRRMLIGVPIAERGASCAGKEYAIYLDDYGYLWKIDFKGVAQKLDYREYLGPLVSLGNIQIVYREDEACFYISSDEEISFIYMETGLFEISEKVTSVTRYQKNQVLAAGRSLWEDKEVIVQTNIIPIRYRGKLTATNAKLHGSASGELVFDVLFRYGVNTSWVTIPDVIANEEGIGYFRATAKDFMLRLRAPNSGAFHIDSLEVGFQVPDKRHSRGIDVSKDSS